MCLEDWKSLFFDQSSEGFLYLASSLAQDLGSFLWRKFLAEEEKSSTGGVPGSVSRSIRRRLNLQDDGHSVSRHFYEHNGLRRSVSNDSGISSVGLSFSQDSILSSSSNHEEVVGCLQRIESHLAMLTSIVSKNGGNLTRTSETTIICPPPPPPPPPMVAVIPTIKTSSAQNNTRAKKSNLPTGGFPCRIRAEDLTNVNLKKVKKSSTGTPVKNKFNAANSSGSLLKEALKRRFSSINPLDTPVKRRQDDWDVQSPGRFDTPVKKSGTKSSKKRSEVGMSA